MSDDTSRSLHRAILAAPFDDAPRLVYADWLDETGDDGNARYAELIRLEVWLSQGDKRKAAGDWTDDDEAAYDRRLRRLGELWWRYKYDWFRETDRSDVDRGFVRTARMGVTTFADRAEGLFRRHPITEVRLYDTWYDGSAPDLVARVTRNWRHPTGWGARQGCWPLELFPGQEGREFHFPTLDEAARVLSDAAVAYGRRLAELPDLRTKEDGG